MVNLENPFGPCQKFPVVGSLLPLFLLEHVVLRLILVHLTHVATQGLRLNIPLAAVLAQDR